MKKIMAKLWPSVYCTVCTQRSPFWCISLRWKSRINFCLVCGERADAVAWLILHHFCAFTKLCNCRVCCACALVYHQSMMWLIHVS